MDRLQRRWVGVSGVAHVGVLGALLLLSPETNSTSSGLTVRLVDAPAASPPAVVAIPVPLQPEKARTLLPRIRQTARPPLQDRPAATDAPVPAAPAPETPADRLVPDASPTPDGALLGTPIERKADRGLPGLGGASGDGQSAGEGRGGLPPTDRGDRAGPYLVPDAPTGRDGMDGEDRRGSGAGTGSGGTGTGGPGSGTGTGGGRSGGGAGLVAGPPSAGGGAGAGEILRAIRNRLEKAKAYPEAARRDGLEGTVEVRFRITPSGRVDTVEIVQSSGHAVLDESALQTVYHAVPYPVIAGWIRVPLSYRLNQ